MNRTILQLDCYGTGKLDEQGPDGFGALKVLSLDGQRDLNLSGLTSLIANSPSLTSLRAALRRDHLQVTLGISESGKVAALAALLSDWEAPALIVVSRPQRAEQIAEELGWWLGDGERVLLFPERDALPFERFSSNAAVRERLRVLSRLSSGRQPLIVASALSLAQRTLSGSADQPLSLRVGQRLDLQAFLARLIALGYTMEPLVEQPGEASRRGGIIDFFPPASDNPARLELLGHEIESLRLFDPVSQRSLRPLTEVEIGPTLEVVLGVEGAEAASALLSGLDFERCTPEARSRFLEEKSLLEQGLSFPTFDFYVPFLAHSTLIERLPPSALLIIDEEAEVQEATEEAQEQTRLSRSEMEEHGELPRGLPSPLQEWRVLRTEIESRSRVLRLSRWATREVENGENIYQLPFLSIGAYGGQIRRMVSDIIAGSRKQRIVLVSQQAPRLAELLSEEGAVAPVSTEVGAETAGISIVSGSLPGGWRFRDDGLDLGLITDAEAFGFTKQRRALPRQRVNREAFLTQIAPGDYVVHVDHGIARFAGMTRKAADGHEREYLELHYAEGDKLYVPVDQLARVSRYAGPSGREPEPTRLSSGEWQRAKQRVKQAVRELARELLTLYASREVAEGHPFPPDTLWQTELEASFPYQETPDQLQTITEVKRDMELPRPMDRLVCGDVGYGKTEVAIRAAFKAALDGRQVAVLVPTTILAQQHYHTFRDRLAAFPLRIEMLSRFRNEAEQRRIVEELASGSIDVIIGTHRLLQKDIRFKELGLLIIDEEQRFGVSHKEYLKKMRKEVDVLTLSATPIPRTLYMSLGGVRDMSIMDTPPEERLPIKTYVSEFDERLVREAIIREMDRGGQVYFVHNRVHNIELIAARLRDIVPEARIAIAHGQMDERDLERAMDEFVQERADVLLCTTIIESGLDIPNVNTIIINQADKLGLGQMYQLRGRVGRSGHRSYAYLFYDRKARLSETARHRLQTIFEATELGAGFQIALRDLEIRGAGNLLGPEQSGNVAAVGLDLYCRLLAESVETMRALRRGETLLATEGAEVNIDLPVTAHLPGSYVSDPNVRLSIYERLSRAADLEELSLIGQEMVDRFGELPPAARNLLFVVTLKVLASNSGIQSISLESGAAVLRLRGGLTAPSPPAWEPLKGVRAGRTRVEVEMGDGWRERLRRTLEQLLAAASMGKAAVGAG